METVAERERYPHWPWVSVVQLARERGEKHLKFWRWLNELDAAAGGTIVRGRGRGKRAEVNVLALQSHAGPSASERDAQISAMRVELENLRTEVAGLIAFRRKARAWFRKNNRNG